MLDTARSLGVWTAKTALRPQPGRDGCGHPAGLRARRGGRGRPARSFPRCGRVARADRATRHAPPGRRSRIRRHAGAADAMTVAAVVSAFGLSQSVQTALLAAGAVFGVGWAAGYFVFFWSTTGQTPGDRIMRIRVR